MLKGRFPWLRSIKLAITEEKHSIQKILKLIQSTVILHNILIEVGELEKKEWIDDDDALAIDDDDRSPVLSPLDVINQGICSAAPKDERRTRLMYYFEEHFYF
jgi:hypothetical protein